MDITPKDNGEILPTNLRMDRTFSAPQYALPRLQIVDDSSPSKPDNYRISPATPQCNWHPSAAIDVSMSGAKAETKTELELISEDWSGRGDHVDFKPNEQVPLKEGRVLGHGSMGIVFETSVRGHAFAWKRRFCRRRIGDAERKELEILKKISHRHIIKLAGSYTHGQFLGLLLYPVAVCDLATVFEDSEAYFAGSSLEPSQLERLETLLSPEFIIQAESGRCAIQINLEPTQTWMKVALGTFILSKMGCIVCAVEYLHGQKIRHKDLKPSNILLSPKGLWLTDFGTATDFSLQTMSTTENWERGTPKYFAPEVAAFRPSGRAADIFSLGCVLLEMYLIYQEGTLMGFRKLRSAQDKSFQANLDQIQEWLRGSNSLASIDHHVKDEIHKMLERDPDQRPSITEIRTNFALVDTLQQRKGGDPIFDDCCRKPFISREEHDKKMSELADAYQNELESIRAEHASRMEDMQKSLTARAQQEKELIHRHTLENRDLRKNISVLCQHLNSTPSGPDGRFTCGLCQSSWSTEQELILSRVPSKVL